MKSQITTAVAVVGAMLLLACSNEPTRVAPTPQATQPPAESPQPEVALQETSITTAEMSPKVEPTVLDSIYFEFDSDAIRNDAQSALLNNRGQLQPDPTLNVRLEGNCDQRGSREYNLALGDRRAQSVKRRMVLLGVRESQLETVSFGKEKPRALGHDEAAWAENRRVDFDIQGQSQR